MILLPTSFCPTVGYLSVIAQNEGEVAVNLSEPYRKQTLRNRALFMTDSGITPFTIPVAKYPNPAPSVSEILISEHGDWRHKLEHTLRSGYGGTPFWEHYEPEILALIHNRETANLTEYNALWLSWLCNKWELTPPTLLPGETTATSLSLEELAGLPFPPYWQIFQEKRGFTNGLSALDLLLSEGPYAVTLLL